LVTTGLKTFQAPPDTSRLEIPIHGAIHDVDPTTGLPSLKVLKELDPVSIVYEDKPLTGNSLSLIKQRANRDFNRDGLVDALEATVDDPYAYAMFNRDRAVNQRNYDLVKQYESVVATDPIWDERLSVFAPLAFQEKNSLATDMYYN
jgi:hypothetical protein